MNKIRAYQELRVCCGDNLIVHISEQSDGIWNVDFTEIPLLNERNDTPKVRVPIRPEKGYTHWVFWKDLKSSGELINK